ncbi:MAG: hypothetical protein ACI30C_09925 [Muribaculaceae bacterium]
MKQTRSISAYIALVIVLMGIVAVYILPILSNNPITYWENSLLSQVEAMRGCNIEAVFSSSRGYDMVSGVYAYIVNLLTVLLPNVDILFLLRLPSAIIAGILTLCLFRFDGTYDNLNASFLSALLFLTTTFVSFVCFTATPVMLPTAVFILSYIALYHWMRRSGKRNSVLLVVATSALIVLTGYTGLIIVALPGLVFCLAKRVNRRRNALLMVALAALSAGIAFLAVFLLTGNLEVVKGTLLNTFTLQPVFTDRNLLITVVFFLVVVTFPWSIPILFNAIWMIRHRRMIVEKLKELSLLQRFGLSVVVISIPSFIFVCEYTFILLAAQLFFNISLVSKVFLAQLDRNPQAWRKTGIATGITAVAIVAAIALNNQGFDLGCVSRFIGESSWTVWSGIVMALTLTGVYTLWRNCRSLTQNRRYFYNIIWLYLLMLHLVIGYMMPFRYI